MATSATYVSDTQFIIDGDKTTECMDGRRVKADCGTDGYKYSHITNQSYDGGPDETTVTLNDSVLTNNLTSILFGPTGGSSVGNIPVHGHLSDEEGGELTVYIKDSEFTQDGGVLIGTGSGMFQEETGSTARTSLGVTSEKLDDFATPDDNTDLDASTSAHGLMPKLPNDDTKFLDGTGLWVTVDTSQPAIETPTNQSPSDSATGTVLSPTLTASGYYSLYGKSQQDSQWQVSTASDFATTVEDTNEGAVTSYTVSTNLSTLTMYYWRVRYQDADGTWSEWSNGTSFTTADIYIDTPSITSPSDGATAQSLTLTISGDTFTCVNGSDTHESSDWEIATDSGFNSIVWQSTDDTSNLESIDVPGSNLSAGTQYYAQVRYTGTTYGDSSWSSTISFTTDEVAQPSITSPTDDATGVGLSADLVGDAFSVSSSDTHTKSDWKVATDSGLSNIVFSSYDDTSNKTSITMSGLSTTTEYFAAVRYYGDEFGWSDWSATVSFTTTDIYIEAPTITSPSDGATDIGETPTLTTDAFNCVNGSDTHASTTWQISDTSSDYSSPVWESVDDASNLESIAVPGGNLSTGTTYYIRVLHEGTTYGDSSWSTEISFNTASSFFDHGPGPGEGSLTMDSPRDVGYYGEATSAEICDGPTLASDIGLSAGTAFNDDAGWLKFYVGPAADCNKDSVAKVLFIAKETLRNNLSWNNIYDAGAVYGTGDAGTANSGSDVTQDAQVTYSSNSFKVRLLTGSAADPAAEGYGNQQCSDDAGAGTEWNDLLYRVHTDVPDCGNPTIGMPGGHETDRHGGPQDGSNWANFTNAELQVYYSDAGDGTYCWCQEQGNDTTRRVSRGFRCVAYFLTTAAYLTNTNYGWRPVLELIQP